MHEGYTQRCYVCNKGKKNSDCSTIETCKKDEDVSFVASKFVLTYLNSG